VTELITGIDLVEQMIRSAFGEKLAIVQADVRLKGSAIESRILAEDPTRNFLPSAGRLKTYRPPDGGMGEAQRCASMQASAKAARSRSLRFADRELVTHAADRTARSERSASSRFLRHRGVATIFLFSPPRWT